MSVDEMTAIHEHYSNLMHLLPNPYGLLRYGWVVIGIAIAIVVALVSIPFLRRIPRKTALRLMIAGSLYVAGAIGVEMIESAIFEPGPESSLYITLVCIEETAEIVGMLLALRAMLYHLTDDVPVRLSLRRGGDRTAGSA